MHCTYMPLYQIPHSCWQKIKMGVMIPSIHYLSIMVLDLLLSRKLLDPQWKKLMHHISGAFFAIYLSVSTLSLFICLSAFPLRYLFTFLSRCQTFLSLLGENQLRGECLFAAAWFLSFSEPNRTLPQNSYDLNQMFVQQASKIEMMFTNTLYFQNQFLREG